MALLATEDGGNFKTACNITSYGSNLPTLKVRRNTGFDQIWDISFTSWHRISMFQIFLLFRYTLVNIFFNTSIGEFESDDFIRIREKH